MRSYKFEFVHFLQRLSVTLRLGTYKDYNQNYGFSKEPKAQTNRCCVTKVPFACITTPGAGKFGQPVTNYCIEVDVGTPPGCFLVQLDIGADDCFLPSDDWSLEAGNHLHHDEGYSSNKSWSCKLTGCNGVVIQYQDCRLTGNLYQDTFMMASLSGTIKFEQTFLAATEANGAQFKYLPIDGCFGLSPKRKSKPTGIATLNVNISNSLKLKTRTFSIWFSKKDGDSPLGGYLIFGEPDYSFFEGRLNWHRSSKKNWAINMVGINVGASCLWKPEKPCRARLSSGVNEIYGPPEYVNRIYAKLGADRDPVSGLAFLPRTEHNKCELPNIVIQTRKYELIVEPGDYLIEMDSRYLVAILPTCSGSSKYNWTLGTVVLATQYTVFQPDRRRVGFARRL